MNLGPEIELINNTPMVTGSMVNIQFNSGSSSQAICSTQDEETDCELAVIISTLCTYLLIIHNYTAHLKSSGSSGTATFTTDRVGPVRLQILGQGFCGNENTLTRTVRTGIFGHFIIIMYILKSQLHVSNFIAHVYNYIQ